jgi:hypothetical protein
MKHVLPCCLILFFAVSLNLCLPAMAANSNDQVEKARLKMLEEDRKKRDEARKTQEAKKAKEQEAKKANYAKQTLIAKKLGFIALSENRMYNAEAEDFCRKYDGRLPRINNSGAWGDINARHQTEIRAVPIDGFGYGHRPWAEVGLDGDAGYWTGTAATFGMFYVTNVKGVVNVGSAGGPERSYYAICVPLNKEETRKAEAVRKAERAAEETRKAEEARAFKAAAGFIALADSRMNWADAKNFCRQKGGKLPRLNNSDSWTRGSDYWRKGPAKLDGFGAIDTPWPSGLPKSYYWTGTERTDEPGNSWGVCHNPHSGRAELCSATSQSKTARVVCVP